MTARRILYLGAPLIAALAVAPPANAQSGNDTLVAEGIFRSAKGLFADGKYAEACPRFAESERIDPKLGTLLNLALCHEKEGKIASAWAEYTEAAELASRAHQPAREEVARKSAASLEPRLAHLVLHAASPPAGLALTLDGGALRAAALGIPIPIDPGSHEVTATAKGRSAFTASVVVPADSSTQTLEIPALAPEAPASMPVPPPVVPVAPAEPTPAPRVPSSSNTLAGSIAGGVGVVGLALGIYFETQQNSKANALQAMCPNMCPTTPALQSQVDSARTDQVLEGVTFGVSAVAVGAAAYFFFAKPLRTAATPAATGTFELAPSTHGGLARWTYAF